MASAPTGWTDEGELDLSGVGKGPPPPPEEGVYEAIIDEAMAAGTKPDANGKSKPAFSLTLTLDRAFNNAEGSMKRKIFDKIVLTQAAAFRLVQLCDAVEVPKLTKTAMSAVEEFCGDLVGKRVWIRLKHETNASYNSGKPTAKVGAYLTAAEAAIVASGGDPYADAADAPVRRGRATAAE